MFRRLLQLLTLAAVVNLVYQYWPRDPVGRLVPAISSDGVGLVDENGYLAVECKWDWIDPFDPGGLAKVQKDDKYGFINRRGEVVIPVKWNSAGGFNDAGYALVALGSGKWGLIDWKGNEVIPPDYDQVSVFADSDYAIVMQKGRYGIARIYHDPPRAELPASLEWSEIVTPSGVSKKTISKSEREAGSTYDPTSIRTFAKTGGKWKLIDLTGKVIAELEDGITSVGPFVKAGQHPRAMIIKQLTKGTKTEPPETLTGWVDWDGEMVIPPTWRLANSFNDQGMAAVEKDGKWGWINADGELVISTFLSQPHAFNAWGTALVDDGAKWGLLDVTGKLLVPPKWDDAEDFDSGGLANVYTSAEGWGCITAKGEVVIKPEWENSFTFDETGYAVVHKGNQSGMIDREGNVKFLIDKAISDFDRNDRALIYEADQLRSVVLIRGLVDRSGEVVFEVPEGWLMLDYSNEWNGVYHLWQASELSTVKKWYLELKNWITGEEGISMYEGRNYDKDGTLIWDSTWLHPETKAWLYLTAAFVPLLFVMWLERRKRKLGEKPSP